MEQLEVAVVVLGDVGRSPRMQFHASSLSDAPWVSRVNLVGLGGHRCIDAVESSPKVNKVLLREPVTSGLSRRFFLLYAPVKILQQSLQLFWELSTRPIDIILVQNPPCIPTFAVLFVVQKLRGSKIIVDWHNLGFTILALTVGERHPVVKIAKLYERVLGKLIGDGHLCVTKAMKHWLVENFGLQEESIAVQYDKAPLMFHERGIEEQHALFERLKDSLSSSGENEFTEKTKDGKVKAKHSRPALIVSSTSWTPDEDFSILLNALVKLDRHPLAPKRKVICVVTGKGPQKEMYEERMGKLGMKHVEIKTLWLEAEDYPVLLGSADLGVCLHMSSSNLDLPMKVVDMFGSGLPVCAVGYACLNELVVHDENGLVFKTEQELFQQLADLLLDPSGPKKLESLREGVAKFAAVRWTEHWNTQTAPVFRKAGKGQCPVFTWLVLLVLVEALVYLVYLNWYVVH